MHLFRLYNTRQLQGDLGNIWSGGTVICLRSFDWLIRFVMHVLNLHFRWPRDKRPHNYCPIHPNITTRFNPCSGDEERHRMSPSSSSGQTHAWTSDLLVALGGYKLYHSSSSGTYTRHLHLVVFMETCVIDDILSKNRQWRHVCCLWRDP